jgi:MFS transporter, YNFM family, putative membrane transport protein
MEDEDVLNLLPIDSGHLGAIRLRLVSPNCPDQQPDRMTPHNAPLTPATRQSILLLSFATFSSMVVQRICDAMLPELSRVFAVSLGQAAQVVSVFAMVYGASQLFYGPMGDRLGKFRIITYATLACSLGSLLAVFATSLGMLVVARMMVALGAAAIIPLAMAWVGDIAPQDQLQETLARVGLGSTLGIVCGQLLGGLLTDLLGWRWAFAFTAVLFTVVGSLLLVNWRGQQALAVAGAATAADEPVSRPGFVAQALAIITGPWSRVVLTVSFIEGATGFGVLAVWASHLHDELDLSLTGAGAIVALFGLGGVAYMATARHLIRRLGQPGLTRLGAGLVALAALVVAFTPYWILALPACLAGGFGFFMLHNTLQANAAQMAPTARGTAVSLFAASLFLGQSLGVLFAARLIDRIGSAAVVAAGGAGVLAIGVYFSIALSQREAQAAI